eukprot:Skav216262  [mRNA]  locus=scaffold20:825505:829972:- [translate_table: standard]
MEKVYATELQALDHPIELLASQGCQNPHSGLCVELVKDIAEFVLCCGFRQVNVGLGSNTPYDVRVRETCLESSGLNSTWLQLAFPGVSTPLPIKADAPTALMITKAEWKGLWGWCLMKV